MNCFSSIIFKSININLTSPDRKVSFGNRAFRFFHSTNQFPTDLQLLPKTFCFTKNLWGAFQSSGQHHLYSQNRMFHKIYCALQNGIILISMQGRKYFHHPAAECYEQISAGPESELTITHANRLYRKTSQPRITSLRLSYIVMFVGENLRWQSFTCTAGFRYHLIRF